MVDVDELRVPVGMIASFLGLAVGLQAGESGERFTL
jgi:hypothetical protein